MILHDIWTVASKELRACFTDKIILMQMIILPFAIVFGYGMLMGVMADANISDDGTCNACVINAPDFMEDAFKKLGIKASEPSRSDALKQSIKDKELDALIIFPADFALQTDPSKPLSNVEVWYSSESTSSISAYNTIEAVLNAFQPKTFGVNADENVKFDLGDENAPFRKVIAMVFPVMVFMATIMVCNNLAAESIAGDKERGFLNTMLITPVKRSSIAAGKSLSIFVASIICSISAFIGMAVSLPALIDKMKMSKSISFGFTEYIQLFFISMTAAFVLVSIMLVISTLAKDVKQSTTIAPIVMIVLMIVGMLTMNDNFSALVEDLGMWNYFIPAWNSMLLMQDIIQMHYSFNHFIITCCTNVFITVLLIFAIGRLFENERIING